MGIDVNKELLSKWQQRWPELTGLEFSKWVLWKHRNSLHNTDRVGVYILAKYQPNGAPDKADPIDEKIIYIGKTNIGRTTSLKKRLSDFDREAFGTSASHSGASTYKEHFGTVQDDLYVSICPIFWSNEELNKLTSNKENYNAWISGRSPRPEPFIVFLLVNWLEVCLRGLYVYKWERLPLCNKE
jgi:hypothetical protein